MILPLTLLFRTHSYIMYNKKHFHSLLGYIGIGFISWAISHGFFSTTRSIIMAIIWIVLFLLSEILKEGEKSYLSLLVFWLVYGVSVGMLSGGFQHFLDSPLRSLRIVPVGYLVSLLVFPYKEHLVATKWRQHLLSILVGLIISVWLYGAFYLAIQKLPPSLFEHWDTHTESGSISNNPTAKGSFSVRWSWSSSGTLTVMPLYNGKAIDDLQIAHEKYIHLILVRQDGWDFLHLHPEKSGQWAWVTPIEFPSAGTRHIYADIDSKQFGPQVITGLIMVDGMKELFTATPVLSTGIVVTQSGVDYTITRDKPSIANTTNFYISINNWVLQDYLGAKGHMVAINLSDMSYSHIHPVESTGVINDSLTNATSFTAHFTKPGIHRVFTQLMVGDQIITLPFTIQVPDDMQQEIAPHMH